MSFLDAARVRECYSKVVSLAERICEIGLRVPLTGRGGIGRRLEIAHLHVGDRRERRGRDATTTVTFNGVTASRLEPEEVDWMHARACAYAGAGNVDRALDVLSHAVDDGLSDVPRVLEEEHLRAPRGSPRFDELVERMRASA